MAFLIGSLLVVLCIALVTYPFLGPGSRRRNVALPDSVQELQLLRQSLYDEMEQLKQDIDAGQASEDEYRGRLETLRRWAAATLRKEHQMGQDRRRPAGELERELEEEIARSRRLTGAPRTSRITTEDGVGPMRGEDEAAAPSSASYRDP